MLEIDIFRNYGNMGVNWDDFREFGCPKDAQMPFLLRLWHAYSHFTGFRLKLNKFFCCHSLFISLCLRAVIGNQFMSIRYIDKI